MNRQQTNKPPTRQRLTSVDSAPISVGSPWPSQALSQWVCPWSAGVFLTFGVKQSGWGTVWWGKQAASQSHVSGILRPLAASGLPRTMARSASVPAFRAHAVCRSVSPAGLGAALLSAGVSVTWNPSASCNPGSVGNE